MSSTSNTSLDCRPETGSCVSSLRKQRDAWLKALENTGLRDALEKTRRFQPSEREGNEQTSLPGDRSRISFGEKIVFVERARDLARRSSVSHLQEIAACRQLQDPLGLPVDQALVEGVAVCLAPGNVVQAQGEVLSGGESGAGALGAKNLTWERSRVTILPYQEGVEVWVRDASLSNSETSALANGLQQMGRLRATVVKRVFVNGKQAFTSVSAGGNGVLAKEK